MQSSTAGFTASAGRHAGRDWRSGMARFGLTAKAVLYAALGILAFGVARGSSGSGEVSHEGAIELVASQPFGRWLLVILTLGLVSLGLWKLLAALTGDPAKDDGTVRRVIFALKGLLYLGAAGTAAALVISNWGGDASGSGGGSGSNEQAAATLMSLPYGPWIVAAVGLAIIGFGGYEAYMHGWKAKFMRRLSRPRLSDAADAVRRAGRVGYGAHGTAAATVGVFFVIAAIQHDPNRAQGLSGALQAMRQQAWGQVVLIMLGVGLLLYGAFALAEAHYRRST